MGKSGKKIISNNLPKKPKILDIGCGKGLLYDLLKLIPDAEIMELISHHAIENSKKEVKKILYMEILIICHGKIITLI